MATTRGCDRAIRRAISSCTWRTSGARASGFSGGSRMEVSGSRLQSIREPRIDQHERHPASLSRSVRPRMVGALLDDDVARPHGRLAAVQYQRQLALEHDAVVDG